MYFPDVGGAVYDVTLNSWRNIFLANYPILQFVFSSYISFPNKFILC